MTGLGAVMGRSMSSFFKKEGIMKRKLGREKIWLGKERLVFI